MASLKNPIHLKIYVRFAKFQPPMPMRHLYVWGSSSTVIRHLLENRILRRLMDNAQIQGIRIPDECGDPLRTPPVTRDENTTIERCY